jgi:hypothetical protein
MKWASRETEQLIQEGRGLPLGTDSYVEAMVIVQIVYGDSSNNVLCN